MRSRRTEVKPNNTERLVSRNVARTGLSLDFAELFP